MSNTVKYFFFKIIAMLLVSSLFLVVPTNTADTHTVKDKENIKLKLTVLSDCHIETNNFDTFNNFGCMLKDVKNCDVQDDVTVFLGDNTMNGQILESMFFYGSLLKSGISNPFLVALGNHDVGNEEEGSDYNTLFPRFQGFNKYMLGNEIDKAYFYRVIDGYYFIVLGTEDTCCYDPVMSDEQVEWFKNILAEASLSGKPIFVLSHHDLHFELGDIFDMYKNIFYLTGHAHMPLSWYTYYDYDNYMRLSIPRSTDVEKGEYKNSGIGFQVEVYDDSVVFRARDYYDGVWIEDFEETYLLK